MTHDRSCKHYFKRSLAPHGYSLIWLTIYMELRHHNYSNDNNSTTFYNVDNGSEVGGSCLPMTFPLYIEILQAVVFALSYKSSGVLRDTWSRQIIRILASINNCSALCV